MKYRSTRDSSLTLTSAEAICRGISQDGGLFVPETFDRIGLEEIGQMTRMTYIERAQQVLSRFLTDYAPQQVEQCAQNAYGGGKFACDEVARVRASGAHRFLELWHGPTCAFKDMALQILPHLLLTAKQITGHDEKTVILVATSGDTGKAALEGFKDVQGTQIIVFYPDGGVSPMQKRQMQTQEGGNVAVCATRGNFDDAQTGVKAIFTSDSIRAKLESGGFAFSSANSINWGRLVPQIVYYFSAYADLVKDGAIALGEKVNFTVPTGNFGNILAGYYAMQMGLPVNRLICASNQNNVLADFMETGVYDRNRPFYQTVSPSMDILISSNLERLLFGLCDGDSDYIRSLYQSLQQTGRFTVCESIRERLGQVFWGGFCDDKETTRTIGRVFREEGYVCDTHTAVGVCVYDRYREQTGDDTVNVVVSTASPYKFASSVLSAVDAQPLPEDDFAMLSRLEAISSLPVPPQIAALRQKTVRFEKMVDKEQMPSFVLGALNLL